jgi:enoyl-CoA hydratase/carnithine racemase
MSASEILQVAKAGWLETVTLNRPERLNAINQPLADALLAYFESKRRDTDTRVIIVAGAGRAFCAGADLKAMGQPDALRDGPNGDWVLRDTLKAMRDCPQPVIALVQGSAAGGGLALALAADVILAAENAAFHPAFIKIGLSGSELGVSWRLQRTIGISRAREMLLTGQPMSATEALQTGLVSRVVPESELSKHGLGMAEAMLRAAPDALRISKRTFDATLETGSFSAALELEERGQIQMIRAGRDGRPKKD